MGMDVSYDHGGIAARHEYLVVSVNTSILPPWLSFRPLDHRLDHHPGVETSSGLHHLVSRGYSLALHSRAPSRLEFIMSVYGTRLRALITTVS